MQVASDPLHLQILSVIRDEAKSVKQIAEELKQDQVKLYYHFKMLEQHGLVKVVMERKVRHMVERSYRIKAYSLRVPDTLLAFGSATDESSTENMLAYVFDKGKGKLKKGLQEGLIDVDRNAPPQRRFIAQRGSMRLPPEQARQFFERLQLLSEEYFERQNNPPSYGDWYDFIVAMYPVKITTP
ncbi:ArsR family transcriptional regulator [bacterium]|nr:ArsR family transcriptional regulator [bacterium]